MTTPDLAGLCERLRETTLIPINPNRPKYGEKLRTQRNPDGPLAAAAIESLVAALERVRNADPYHVSSQIARTALEGASDDR